jgi:hypothetical protein
VFYGLYGKNFEENFDASNTYPPFTLINMKTQTAEKTYSIGPGKIATPNFTGGPAFALSTTEWIAIQTYVVDSLALPTDEAAFKKSLGPGAPSSLVDFIPLIAAYKAINAHCTTWKNDTYPSSVELASNIHSYALAASTYYNPILPLARILTANPNDADAKAKLEAILSKLSKDATDNQTKASAVAVKIKAFADQTSADKVELSGKDGKGGLVKKYNDEFGSTSAEVAELTKQLKAQQEILKSKNAEYDHDVVVAATTPTYAWVWPIGTIAAAIVAGVYGKKATDALEAARAAQQKINSLSDKLAADANLMVAINSAELGMTTILNSLNAALPVIQKIEGVWGAIAGDLSNIVNLIKTDIGEALPIIMDLGVEEAITAWTSVGLEADSYRVNAYVTVKS